MSLRLIARKSKGALRQYISFVIDGAVESSTAVVSSKHLIAKFVPVLCTLTKAAVLSKSDD
jgi:hypothetical protein